MLEMDHLVVVAERLEDGVARVESQLGVELQQGGKHDFMGTHNALLSLGPGLYLEVIAVDPDAPAPDRARWFGLDGFSGTPRLGNWVCRSDDLSTDLARAPEDMGAIMDAARGALRWQMVVPKHGQYPFEGAFPGMIQWKEGGHPSERLADRGVRLEKLEIATPSVEKLQSHLPEMFDSDKVWISAEPMTRLCARLDIRGRKVTLT